MPYIGFVAAAIDTRQSESSAAMTFCLSNRSSGALATNSTAPQKPKNAAIQSGQPSSKVDLSQRLAYFGHEPYEHENQR